MIRARLLYRLSILGLFGTLAFGQPWGPGRANGPGMGHDVEHQADMELFHYLLDNRSLIRRSVENLPEGVETLTESDDSQVANGIKEHVRSMYGRVKENRPIHLRDPLFQEIFNNANKIRMVLEETENGMRVRETSGDPWVAKLIQEHAKVINLFLANGRSEVGRDHALP